jgi:hypothetical protein
MSEYSNVQVKKIIDFFDSQGANYWKTVEEIAMATELNSALVSKILSTSGEFVRSSYRSKAGEPVFTSRKLFRDKASFVDKMIGSFKNRID